jgi:hypothetical protein
MIAREHYDFAYPQSRCWLRVNGKVLSGGRSVGEIVERLGREWKIEPLSERRARHALVIDDSDFEEAFELIAPWAEAGDRAYFESLYPLHYASETFRFAPDYIGDAVILTAHRMVENGHPESDAILQALADAPCGLYCAEYENNLFDPRDETAAIEALQHRVFHPRKATLTEKLTARLCRKAPKSFEGYGIGGGTFALYTGPNGEADRERFREALAARGATLVDFERSDRLIGRSLIESRPALACRKAGTMLAAAYDSGAQALVFARVVDLRCGREHFGAIEREMARELPLPLISHSEFAERFLREESETVPAAS